MADIEATIQAAVSLTQTAAPTDTPILPLSTPTETQQIAAALETPTVSPSPTPQPSIPTATSTWSGRINPTKNESSRGSENETLNVQIDQTSANIQATKPDQLVNETQNGWACFGTFGFGLSCLNAQGEWEIFNRDNSPLHSDLIKYLTPCIADQLLIIHSSGLNLFDGQTWETIDSGWGHGSAEAGACDTNGGIWVAHFRGVSYFDGEAWTTYDAKNLASGPDATDLVRDVAVAADGTVWVTTSSSIAKFDGQAWAIYQEKQGFQKRYFPEFISLDRQDQPWVMYSHGLLHYAENTWQDFDGGFRLLVKHFILDNQDRPWVGTFKNGIALFDDNRWRTIETYPGHERIRALASDSQGRIWIGTAWGLTVLDGQTWTTYHMHTANLADNQIWAIGIIGNGPTLPELQVENNGSVSGQLVDKRGTPLMDIIVELCAGWVSTFQAEEAPCDENPARQEIRTDAEGNFSFSEVLPGHYALTALVPGYNEWFILTGKYNRVENILVEPGKNTNLFQIVAEPEV